MAAGIATAVETLNQLIETCKDGENGFRTAAGGVTMPDLKHLFESYANQRGLFANELQTQVERLGGKAQEHGSVTAALHRGWMNIKSLVTRQDEGAIINECEQGEEATRKTYEEALHADLPPEVRTIVERQFGHVKEAHDRLRALQVAATTPPGATG